PANVVSLRKIFTSLRDGMSSAKDWFKNAKAVEVAAVETPKQALDQAMFEQVKASVSSGDLDKAFVLSGEAGYQLSEQQHAEIVGL
ncbi:hypothetical protein ABLU04_15580, partial [Acinetobacter indicus]